MDQHLVLGDHVLASQDLEQRGLARAVRAEQQAARAGLELEVHALDERLAADDGRAVDAGVGPVQVVDAHAPLRGRSGRRDGGVGRGDRRLGDDRRVGGHGHLRGARGLRGLELSLAFGERGERAGGLHHGRGDVDAAARLALPARHGDGDGHRE